MLTGFHINHKKKWRDWGGRSLLGPSNVLLHPPYRHCLLLCCGCMHSCYPCGRPCVSRALGNQYSNPARCHNWARSSGRQACRCTHAVCILPFPSASARCCNAVVLSHGFVASSVKQCDAHMPPTRSSEPSCETLKQPPGHLETHPRASSPRHPRLRKTALVASLLNLTWIFMITLNR